MFIIDNIRPLWCSPILPLFTLFNHVYLCLSMFTHVYLCLLMFTSVYSLYFHVYICLPQCLLLYVYPSVYPSVIYSCVPLFILLYSCLHLSNVYPWFDNIPAFVKVPHPHFLVNNLTWLITVLHMESYSWHVDLSSSVITTSFIFKITWQLSPSNDLGDTSKLILVHLTLRRVTPWRYKNFYYSSQLLFNVGMDNTVL